MANKFPSDTADKFMLRLPTGMRDRIAAAAKVAGRSMNSELIARLEASFAGADFSLDKQQELNRLVFELMDEMQRFKSKLQQPIDTDEKPSKKQ